MYTPIQMDIGCIRANCDKTEVVFTQISRVKLVEKHNTIRGEFVQFSLKNKQKKL